MKTQARSKDFRQKFIDKTDSDISIEIIEEMMLPQHLSFTEFYAKYQAKHEKKYGHILKVTE